jgi:acylphosphatase
VKRARVRISGRVQGVFFRAETSRRARSLGVSGWVQNVHGGSVEAVFEGRPEAVESMVAWCGRGPSGAAVSDMDVTWEEPQGTHGFDVR